MQTIKYVYCQEDDSWLCHLEEYPDYWSQGDTLADLVENLKDLYLDLSCGYIAGARKVGELVMSRSGPDLIRSIEQGGCVLVKPWR